MLKVMTIGGTRPEIIRLSRTIDKLDRHCSHVLVHTGQNYDYELNEVFFRELGIRRPDNFLEAAGATAAETIGKVIIAADRVLEEHQPDAMLLLGDTNSALAAIAAKRRKVPIFHIHGDADTVVPLERNAGELVKRYKKLGGPATLKIVPGKGHEEVDEFFTDPDFLKFVLEKGTLNAAP